MWPYFTVPLEGHLRHRIDCTCVIFINKMTSSFGFDTKKVQLFYFLWQGTSSNVPSPSFSLQHCRQLTYNINVNGWVYTALFICICHTSIPSSIRPLNVKEGQSSVNICDMFCNIYTSIFEPPNLHLTITFCFA